MTNSNDESAKRPSRSTMLKIIIVGLVGYLIGSFFPAGYVNYLIRSKLFPETLGSQNLPFDRKNLDGAKEVPIQVLLDSVDQNPSAFATKYVGKPIIVSGEIQYFLDQSIGQTSQTITLETGFDYRGIFLVFDDPTNSKVVALKKGGPIRAVCMVTGNDSSNVHLGHCEVMS